MKWEHGKMSEWLVNMISEKTFDDPVETQMDSLDNVFKVKQTAELIGVSPDSVLNMPDSAVVAAADSALQQLQFQGPPEGPPKVPEVPKDWSFEDSPVGEYLTGGEADWGTKWFLNPNVSFTEWMSDVGQGTGGRVTLFGKPLKGLSKTSPLYDPSGRPGEEKYNEKYVNELTRRMSMLENPEAMITNMQGGRQYARIDRDTSNILSTGSEYERMFSEELDYRKFPELSGAWRNVKGGGTIEDFVQTPEYAKTVASERSRYYNEALNALERLPEDSPASEQLASFMARDPWRVFDPEYEPEDNRGFLPIPEEIAELKGWDRNPFQDVADSLDAISDFKAESLAADLPITMQDVPEWMYDPQFDQVPVDAFLKTPEK